jgi:L-aspartate semialdehyde sulfurtransferase ferredoxin
LAQEQATMVLKRVRLTFPEVLIKEPIIYLLGHEFEVVTSIRMADIDEHVGWAILELDGDETEVVRALDWAEAKGVRVDPVEGDVVEGN